MPGIHLDVIDDLSMNAIAFVENKQGYIGIFRGAILLVYDLFYRLLSHPDIFPEIGDPNRELVRQFHSEGTSRHYSGLISKRSPDDQRIGAVLPNDPARIAHANWLALNALDFLLQHEIAHIRHGHCEYWDSIHGVPFLAELNANSGLSTHDSLTRQTLEMDADAYAATNAISRILSFYKGSKLGVIQIGQHSVRFPATSIEALRSWQYAVQFLFWMLGLSFDPATLDTISHPFPAHRILLIVGTADAALRISADEGIRSDFRALQTGLMTSMINSHQAISGGILDPNFGLLIDAYLPGGVFQQHSARVLEHWKIIRPELIRFSHAPNLAP
jgi:hypothetical protein